MACSKQGVGFVLQNIFERRIVRALAYSSREIIFQLSVMRRINPNIAYLAPCAADRGMHTLVCASVRSEFPRVNPT
jgi:hypothetical protein